MFEEFDTVELVHDIKEHGLTKGDIGAVVNIYNTGTAYEVEFVASDGTTKALLTLKATDIRKHRDSTTYISSTHISLGTVSGLTTFSISEKDKYRRVDGDVNIDQIYSKTNSEQNLKNFNLATL